MERRRISRKLDAGLARALGREVIERGGEYWYPGRIPWKVERFSEDGNDMLYLHREMQRRGYLLWVHHFKNGKCAATYWLEYKYNNSLADAIPPAVALAAYKALTGKEWIE